MEKHGLHNIIPKKPCPECLELKDREELDMFGGLCEECSEAFNNGNVK